MTAVRKMQLVRFGTWTSLATLAVLVAFIAAHTESGVRRLSGLLSRDPPPDVIRTARAPSAAPAPQAPLRQIDDLEARRLSEAVRVLAADRDRLLARVAALEQRAQPDDVTGSIPPQTAPAPQAPPRAQPLPSIPPQASVPMPQPAPAARPAAPSANAPVTVPGPAESIATKTEFGIDIGSNISIDGLRTLWTTLKANQPAVFENLRPVIAIRDGPKPGTVELRLVAGPIPNAGMAAKLCAVLNAAGQQCTQTVFDGQRLALQ